MISREKIRKLFVQSMDIPPINTKQYPYLLANHVLVYRLVRLYLQQLQVSENKNAMKIMNSIEPSDTWLRERE